MKSALSVEVIVVVGVVSVLAAVGIPCLMSRPPQRAAARSMVAGQEADAPVPVGSTAPSGGEDKTIMYADKTPDASREFLWSSDSPPLTIHWQAAESRGTPEYEMMFSKYLPGLLRDMKPPIDLAEKYHAPPASIFPDSIMGFKPWVRAGDSLAYDIPGTYQRTGDDYYLAVGAERPINSKMAFGADAYVMADSPSNSSGLPGPAGNPSSAGSALRIGTYDLATFGTGPYVTYSRKIFTKDVNFRIQVYHEFNGDGTDGNGVFLSAGFDF